MNFNQDLRKVMILYPEIEVQSKQDFQHLVNIHNVLESVFGEEPDVELIQAAFDSRNIIKLESANDYFYLIFKTAKDKKSLIKKAYPNQGDLAIPEEYNIEKWADLVYKIYDAVKSGDMDLITAIDYYADTLDKKSSEDENFKKWIKYYQSGENQKYSQENVAMKKNSFQFPLMGPGFYGPENAVVPDQPKLETQQSRTTDYSEWKNKLYSTIRRLDKLLRQGDELVDSDVSRDLADLLHQFDQEVRALRLKSTASDLAYRYANQFKKLGFNNGYSEFIKFAQENEPIEQSTPELPSEGQLGAQEKQAPTDESVKSVGEAMAHGAGEEAGPKDGEYESLNGNVGLEDAVSKLEEIAGMLSDRRTIRLLAEFDIILDKIGIASMFPELAEAQSKLIDGNSYALTRVMKMLGMLSSGKSLVEISEAKKKDLNEKTDKEVDKTFEAGGGEEQLGEDGGNQAIQEGLKETPEQSMPPVNKKPSPVIQ